MGPYQLLRSLSRNDVAELFTARRKLALLEQELQLEVLDSDLGRAPGVADRYLEEGRRALRLASPLILRVLDVGRDGDEAYIVRELSEGSRLGQVLRAARQFGTRVPGFLALAWAQDLSAPVAHAHAARDDSGAHAGLVHGALGPEEWVFASDGVLRLGGFGRGPFLHQLDALRPMRCADRAGYLAPELGRGEPLEKAADVFSVAAVLHELFAGRAVFEGGDLAATRAVVSSDAPAPACPRDEVPGPVAEWIDAALAKRPEARPSIEDLRARLAELEGARPPTAFEDRRRFFEAIGLPDPSLALFARGVSAEDVTLLSNPDVAANFETAMVPDAQAVLRGLRERGHLRAAEKAPPGEEPRPRERFPVEPAAGGLWKGSGPISGVGRVAGDPSTASAGSDPPSEESSPGGQRDRATQEVVRSKLGPSPSPTPDFSASKVAGEPAGSSAPANLEGASSPPDDDEGPTRAFVQPHGKRSSKSTSPPPRPTSRALEAWLAAKVPPNDSSPEGATVALTPAQTAALAAAGPGPRKSLMARASSGEASRTNTGVPMLVDRHMDAHEAARVSTPKRPTAPGTPIDPRRSSSPSGSNPKLAPTRGSSSSGGMKPAMSISSPGLSSPVRPRSASSGSMTSARSSSSSGASRSAHGSVSSRPQEMAAMAGELSSAEHRTVAIVPPVGARRRPPSPLAMKGMLAMLVISSVLLGFLIAFVLTHDRTVAVTVHSSPAQAFVLLDGQPLPGATPVVLAGLSPGRTYIVRISKEDYIPVDTVISIPEGVGDFAIEVKLDPRASR